MSWFAAVTLGLAVFVMVMIVWRKAAHDDVGDYIAKIDPEGVQGKVAFWLKENAPLRAPRPPTQRRRRAKPDPESPAGRALAAMLREEMVVNQITPEAAHQRLTARSPGPVSTAFLGGHMGRATILYARSRFAGPPWLFWPWFFFIALVRFGRRRLYLDTVTHVVREMRS